MIPMLDPDSPVPLTAQLEQALRRRVHDGRLAPGARLPTIHDLAERLGVNPNTVAASYRQLESEGYLTTARRAGTRVADAPPGEPADDAAAARLLADAAQRLERLGVRSEAAHRALHAALADARNDGGSGGASLPPLRLAVLGRTPIDAARAAERARAALEPGEDAAPPRLRFVPVTPEAYRSLDYHLTLIDPALVPTLAARANRIPAPESGPQYAYGPDFPAGAD